MGGRIAETQTNVDFHLFVGFVDYKKTNECHQSHPVSIDTTSIMRKESLMKELVSSNYTNINI